MTSIAPIAVAVSSPSQPRSAPSNERLPDLDAVPGQIGHAVLSASDGSILYPPSGSLTEQDIAIVYRMILEVGTLLDGSSEGLQRVTVGFPSVSYAVTLGGESNEYLYIVKKRSSPWYIILLLVLRSCTLLLDVDIDRDTTWTIL